MPILTITKGSGLVAHDIVMHSPKAGIEFAVDIADNPKMRTISFTPTKVGKYPVFSTKKQFFFPSHRDKGMDGTLEVRDWRRDGEPMRVWQLVTGRRCPV